MTGAATPEVRSPSVMATAPTLQTVALAQRQPLGHGGVAHSGIAGRISERPRDAARPGRAAPSGYPRRPGATPVPGGSEPGCTQDDIRRPGQAARSWPRPGDGRGQSRRSPGRPRQPAVRPLDATSRRQQQRWGVCWIFNRCRGMASDRRDGLAQRHEGGAERDHRALAPASNHAEPLAELTASLPVPGFPAKATSTAAQLSPDAMIRNCR